MKKNYVHPTFKQYKKKLPSIYFLFTVWEKLHEKKKLKALGPVSGRIQG
jgi:hypothetical protein